MTETSPVLAGVVGSPISHSLSPLIHAVWAARAGVDGYYLPVECPAGYDSFKKIMDSLRTVGFAGVNVTLPHKENALRYASTASHSAQAAGAANMITFSENGAAADNSDVGGFAAALREQLAPDERPAKAVMLGAGGAARGVLLALRDAGCREIVIVNRTREKAELLAKDCSCAAADDWPARSDALAGADIVVNTTSLGMTGQPPLEISLGCLNPGAIVADIVYAPLETPLLENALQKRHRIVDGLAMLTHQAAPGFRFWFGAEAEVDKALRETLVQELRRRSAS